MDGWVWVSVSPEVHDELLGLLSLEQQVVAVAPLSQTIHLLPVGGLIVVFDEADHRGVVCKLNDGIGTIDRFAVMGEEGVEEGTHHPALWCRGEHFETQ